MVRRFAINLAAALMILAGVATSAQAVPIFFDGFEDAGTRGWSATIPASCTDGRKTGDETDVDCGGTSCQSCAIVCTPPSFGEIGGPCDSNDDCGAADSLCFTGQIESAVFAPEGYCKVDDFSLPTGTCATDADCPSGALCVEWLDFPGYLTCMPACLCGGAACPAHQACTNSFSGNRLSDAVCVPGRAGAEDGVACEGVYECDEFSSCVADAEHPGGECQRTSCIVGDDSTCNGGHCVTADPGSPVITVCVDTCALDFDCRAEEGYRCFDPGSGASDYCRHPHVGDACTVVGDCGGAGWTCKTGASYPGGYCTQTGCTDPGSSQGCPTGTICSDDPLSPTNFCADRCTGAGQGTCRAGYACLDADPGAGTILACQPSL